MNFYKSQLNKIKIALGLETEVFASMLKDGVTKVEAEALEPGKPLYVVSETGEKAPAPAGVHEFEDGTKVTCEEEGIISAVEYAEEKVEEIETELEETPKELEEKENPEEKEVKVEMTEEAIDKKIEEAMSKVYMAVEEVAKEIGSIKQEMGAYKEKMEKMSATPAAKKIGKFNYEASEDEVNSVDAKLESLKKLREEFSNKSRNK
jgi:hypothetical protein